MTKDPVTKKQSRPEDIIVGTDPVAIDILKQIYSAISDISEERRSFLEKCWLQGIKKMYSEGTKLEPRLCLQLMQDIYVHLQKNNIWEATEEELYEVLEKIISLKASRDTGLKQMFDSMEESVYAVLQLDYSKKVPLTRAFKDRRNIFNFIVLLFNSVIEKVEVSTVSAKSINGFFNLLPNIALLITDKKGNLRFANQYAVELLGIGDSIVSGLNARDIIIHYDELIEEYSKEGSIKETPVQLIPFSNRQQKIRAALTIPKTIKQENEIDETVFVIKLKDDKSYETSFNIVREANHRIASLNSIAGTLSLLKKKIIDKESQKYFEQIEEGINGLNKNSASMINAAGNYQTKLNDTINLKLTVNNAFENVSSASKLEDVVFECNTKDIHAFKSNRKLIESVFEGLFSDALVSRKPFEKIKLSLEVREKKDGLFFVFYNSGNSYRTLNPQNKHYNLVQKSIEQLNGETDFLTPLEKGYLISGFIPCSFV